jgi:hypothetical protein
MGEEKDTGIVTGTMLEEGTHPLTLQISSHSYGNHIRKSYKKFVFSSRIFFTSLPST